jgi:hypothetical protein
MNKLPKRTIKDKMSLKEMLFISTSFPPTKKPSYPIVGNSAFDLRQLAL